MLSKLDYLCCSTSPAVMVCVQQGCSSYALCCSAPSCQCKTNHNTHNMQMLTRVIQLSMVPAKMPQQYAKIEKDINALIDGLVNEMQVLKAQHKQHIQHHIDKYIACGALQRKLASKEQIELKEAVGNSFYELLVALSMVERMPSPYALSQQQLEKSITALDAEAKTLRQRIEQLWKQPLPLQQVVKPMTRSEPPLGVTASKPLQPPERGYPSQQGLTRNSANFQQETPAQNLPPPNFLFSGSLKHPDIQLKDGNKRATLSGTSNFGIAVVKPSLAMSTTSKIIFRLNKINGAVFVGVCYQHRVEQLKYRPLLFETGQGIYMHGSRGYIYSDSSATDNGKQLSQLHFDAGELVAVELQPASGRIVYSTKSGYFVQKCGIRSSTTIPTNFFVWLHSGCDVSISDRSENQACQTQ